MLAYETMKLETWFVRRLQSVTTNGGPEEGVATSQNSLLSFSITKNNNEFQAQDLTIL
jgi:hypothetical protein